jgi:ribose-phosphate pyrophosphokinase
MSAGPVLCTFADSHFPAAALARELRLPCQLVDCHHFPDGESRVRLDPLPERIVVYRALQRPNDKLIELLLLASVAQDAGRPRPILVAPYLPYMRQDAAMRPGEAVSQRVIGRLLGEAYGAVITVDPHLHRTHSLGTVLPNSTAIALSAAPLLATLIDGGNGGAPLLVGPDEESEPLVAAVARTADCPFLILQKTRHGDRDVTIAPSDAATLEGRRVVLIDDMVSTGATLVEAASHLHRGGCAGIEALTVHALFDDQAALKMRDSGIERVRSTDAVPHASNAVALAPLLAGAVQQAIKALASGTY